MLADAKDPIARFFDQGLAELGPRLGPILWQFMPTKRFDPEDFERFLDLLPEKSGGLGLRHCVEPRHESFVDDRFVRMCSARAVAICVSDHATYPLIEAPGSPFIYARLMRLDERRPLGYPRTALAEWARRLAGLAADGRDLFVFFIGAGGAGKLRAPAAATALLREFGVKRPPLALPQGKTRT